MKTVAILLLAVALMCLGGSVLLAGDGPAAVNARTPFFYPQYCFGFGASDPKYSTPAEQLRLLRELGYDGYSHYKIDGLSDVLKALDANHLKLFQFYIQVSLDPAKPKFDVRLKDAIASLKGRDTIISLLMDGGPPSKAEKEQRMVEIMREVADMAAVSGLRVAVYPYYISIQDAVRVAQKTGRKNVGVIFSEVFYFLSEDEKDIESTLKSAMPYIYAVNINGTDSGCKDKDLARLIQGLDRGSYDNIKLLKPLRELGYAGPIGLHCCYVHGDVRDNLTRSMKAWKELLARLNAQSP
jgi:sugar phosphate isomerase/epimerase